jgi:protein kinase A
MPHFALKVLAKAEIVRLKQVEHIQSERGILGRVKHPFIVELCVGRRARPRSPLRPTGWPPAADACLPSFKCSYQTYQDAVNVYMLLSYVPGGELFSHLRRAGRFTADVTRFYLSSIILAIACASSVPAKGCRALGQRLTPAPPLSSSADLADLHSQDIIYRDLKPENLLLDRDGYLRWVLCCIRPPGAAASGWNPHDLPCVAG